MKIYEIGHSIKYEFAHSATGNTKMTGTKTYGKIEHLFLFTFYVNNKPNTVPECRHFLRFYHFETESRF